MRPPRRSLLRLTSFWKALASASMSSLVRVFFLAPSMMCVLGMSHVDGVEMVVRIRRGLDCGTLMGQLGKTMLTGRCNIPESELNAEMIVQPRWKKGEAGNTFS